MVTEGEDKENLNENLILSSNDGVIISKQKRARAKDNELLGHNFGLDVEMHHVAHHNQKNLALAGPVLQARPPQ